MQAIGIRKGRKEAELFSLPEPKISRPDEVLLEMASVGVCLTDKDVIENSLVDSPPGEDRLIIGHEAVGRVLKAGSAVKRFKKGDYAAIIPRHGCNICQPCKTGRSDYCETGLYTSSGQHKRHGFNMEYYVESESYLVKVPDKLADVAALVEPFSIIEKALEQIEHIQGRIPTYRLEKRKALVFGMGSVGMAAIATLRARGIETHVLGRRGPEDIKVKLVKEMGAKYINIREKNVMGVKKEHGTFDIIIEATGATQMVIDLIEVMSRNGLYVFLGIPKGAEELCFNIKGMINKLVRQNLIIAGSVNSQRPHFEAAITDMAAIQKKYNNILNRIITERYDIKDYQKAFAPDEGEGHIKAVIEYKKV